MKPDAYIIIHNCTRDALKTMLKDWLVMYADRLKSNMCFEMAAIYPNSFVLKVDKGIDDTHFFYMVNYFSYPCDFNQTFEVEGYATATKHKRLLNKNIYVFVNKQDGEYDTVGVTTEEGETYTFDFGGKFKKMNAANNYKALDTAYLSISYELIHIDKKELLEEAKKRDEEKGERSTAKRFSVVSTLLFVLLPLAFLINRDFPYIENLLLTGIFSYIITLWFLMDYAIFNDIRRVFICVLLSLLTIAFGVSFTATFASLPLSSILVMLFIHTFFSAKLAGISNSRWDRLFFAAQLIACILLSVFVFSPVLNYFF